MILTVKLLLLYKLQQQQVNVSCWTVFFVNIIGDELLLNFGAKFQRQFVINYKIAMATCSTSPFQDGDEVLKCHE